MAVYRLHRKEWEKGIRPVGEHSGSSSGSSWRKRRHVDDDVKGGDGSGSGDVRSGSQLVGGGGGRKGVSSGLSTVVRRGRGGVETSKWWKELGGRSGKSKGSMRL